MKKYFFKMPFKKSLSYAFARVSGQDILCTNMLYRIGKNGTRSQVAPALGDRLGFNMRYSFVWYEARPLPDDATLYSVERCSYSRNGWGGFTGERIYNQLRHRRQQVSRSTGVYFSRAEAVQQMKALEQQMIASGDYALISNTPSSLRAFSVHKRDRHW